MIQKILQCSLFIALLTISNITYAKGSRSTNEQSKVCSQGLQNVIFKPQTIFDENEQGFSVLHRWANNIHIDTKTLTLENEADFFIKKCDKSYADMAELERHLRSRRYLRDAKVTSDDMVENITVTTWDNWSLMPTVSFGRQGGESTYSLGLKERNLLGLGIDAEIQTYNNSQRKGFKFKSTIPLFRKKNIDLNFRFANNDDGTQQSVFLQKHFASFYTNIAYQVGFNEESRSDTIYQNTSKIALFSHQISFKSAEYAWLGFNNDNALLRYRIGLTQDKHKFSTLKNTDNGFSSPLVPQDRSFVYPWFGINYIEKNFKKMTNIHLITQIEDFNHGWQFDSRLGFGDGSKKHSAWAFFQANINKGFEIHDKALLLMDIDFESEIYEHQSHRSLLNFNAEYFYNIDTNWGIYLSNITIVSKNQYLDQPITIGGNTGLRGFPLQYQHGEKSIKFTSEIRYYPHINLFKLFDLAGAAFLDSGKALGKTQARNTEDTWLYAIGIGARLYSPHSTGNNQVVHIDFAFPQSNDPNINNIEIRIEAKKSF